MSPDDQENDDQENSAKVRRFRKLGYGCFSIALLLWLFAHPAGSTARIWIHAVSGFLLGFSIVALLAGVRFSRSRV